VPGRIFTPQERKRLDAFPSGIGESDLIRYFTLSGSNLDLVRRQRGDHNRLGFALQLCALRYIGFSPDDLETVPTAAMTFVAEQLQVSPAALREYGARSQTRTEHLQQIQLHIGFRDATREDFNALADWLLTRALEHDKPSLLFQLACEHLHAEKIIRPGVTRIERLVMEMRERGHRETFRRLESFFTEERLIQLDQVLVREERLGRTPLAWLGERAAANTSKAILAELKKLDFLRELGVTEWDLSTINPNRLKFLAQIGRRATSQALQRLAPARRYPIIASFLRHSMEEITDELVDIFDRCLAQSYSRAGRELDEFRLTNAKATNQKVLLLQEIGRVVLDPNVSDEQLRQTIYRDVPADKLLAAVEECEQLVRPLDDSYFDFLARRYNHIREFAPAFLHAFEFRSNRNSDPLLASRGTVAESKPGAASRCASGCASEVRSNQMASLRGRRLRTNQSPLLRVVRALGIAGGTARWRRVARRQPPLCQPGELPNSSCPLADFAPGGLLSYANTGRRRGTAQGTAGRAGNALASLRR